jgi:hypothetical protein
MARYRRIKMVTRIMRKLLVFALLLSLTPRAFAQADCYSDIPNVLDCEVDSLARAIVDKAPNGPLAVAGAIGGGISRIMFFTVADALTDIKSLGTQCSFQAYQHLGETARTDKQIGASAKSEGSTTLVEKPGFARLLGFAIERGAIKQSVDKTTLTLSTSPYALIAAAKQKDTSQLYQDYSFLNRFGLSASFNISNTEDVLANASGKQLTEWSVRLRLTGDRSTRGKDFREFWRDKIRTPAGKPAALENVAENLIVNSDAFKTLYIDLQSPGKPNSLADQVNDYIAKNPNDTPEIRVLKIKQIILCSMRKLVYDPVKANPKILPEPTRTQIISNIIPALAATPAEVEIARQLLESFLKELENKPQSTFEYTNHRTEMGSDYSELKLLYRMNAKPMKVNFNAGISLYNNPDEMMNQDRIRDFSVALSLEGDARNPFARGIDLGRITYSFAGSYERLKENEDMMMRKPDIASLQFKLEIPIALGLSIPVAYTYSSATEMSMKKENKFNIGLHLDVDKLYEIARGNRQ